MRARRGAAEPALPPAVKPILELRLVPVAAASWLAAGIAVRAGSAGAAAMAVLLAAAVLLLLPAALRTKSAGAVFRMVAMPLAAATLVCTTAAFLQAERLEGPVGPAITAGSPVAGDFRALTDARSLGAGNFGDEDRFMVEAVLEEASAGGQRFTSSATVTVMGAGFGGVQLGDRFSTAGVLQATEPGNRSVALLFAQTRPRVEAAGGWYRETARLRTAFAGAAREHAAVLGNNAAQLLPGMVLGGRSTLGEPLETAMKNTGLTHLTAVSGANCGYLLAFVFLAARAMRLPRPAAAALGILALVGFVLVVRPDASVLRAALMGSLGTLAVLTGRGKLPAALLSLSICLLLAVDPWLSGSYGFILSVLATTGLILAGPRLAASLARRMPWTLAAAVSVPLAAQLFCAPVLVLLQPSVPAYSLPANLAAAPVVPLVTVAGMGAVMLAAVSPLLAAPLVLAAGAGAAWTAAVAGFFNGLPGALLPWPAGPPGALLMAAASLVIVLALLWHGKSPRGDSTTGGRRPGNAPSSLSGPGRRQRKDCRTAVAALGLLVLPCAGVLLREMLVPAVPAADWMVVACDVGQGDGLVVRSGEHSAMVIDAGPDPDSIDRCLRRLQVLTVDVLILTHAHADHYGGAEGVFRDREVRLVAYSTAGQVLPSQLRQLLKTAGVETLRLSEGMRRQTGQVAWEVLWPPADPGQLSENDASAVILLAVDQRPAVMPAAVPTVEEPAPMPPDDGRILDLLVTGDVEAESAVKLLARNPWLAYRPVDVLKVAHHGARNGGTALFEALEPPLALVSVGADNDYGHPAPATLRALAEHGSMVARTDELGTVGVGLRDGVLAVSSLDGRSLAPLEANRGR